MRYFVLRLSHIYDTRKSLVGGKAIAIAKMAKNNLKII